MLRTLIEVSAENYWDFERKLDMTLGQLGYQKSDSPEHVNWKRDLFEALIAKGLKPEELVDEYRDQRERELKTGGSEG